jgi:hypothetical protein
MGRRLKQVHPGEVLAEDQFFFFGWGTGSTIRIREPGGGSLYFLAFTDEEGR